MHEAQLVGELPPPTLVEQFADREFTVFGITGTMDQLMGLCPVAHDPNKMTPDAVNKFAAKVLHEAGVEIPEEFAYLRPEPPVQPDKAPDPAPVAKSKTLLEQTMQKPIDPSPDIKPRVEVEPVVAVPEPIIAVPEAVRVAPVFEPLVEAKPEPAILELVPEPVSVESVPERDTPEPAPVAVAAESARVPEPAAAVAPVFEVAPVLPPQQLRTPVSPPKPVVLPPEAVVFAEPASVLVSYELPQPQEIYQAEALVSPLEPADAPFTATVEEILFGERESVDAKPTFEAMAVPFAVSAEEELVLRPPATTLLLPEVVSTADPALSDAKETAYPARASLELATAPAELVVEVYEDFQSALHDLAEITEQAKPLLPTPHAETLTLLPLQDEPHTVPQAEAAPAPSVFRELAERLEVLDAQEKEPVMLIIYSITEAVEAVQALKVSEASPEDFAIADGRLVELCIELFEAISLPYDDQKLHALVQGITRMQYIKHEKAMPAYLEYRGTHEVKRRAPQLPSAFGDFLTQPILPGLLGTVTLLHAYPTLRRDIHALVA